MQIEYSLMTRTIEDAILATARELGIAVTACGVLSRGLLTGHWRPGAIGGPTDYRSHLPRFVGDNLHRKLALAEAVPPGAVAGTRYPEPQMAMLDSERGG